MAAAPATATFFCQVLGAPSAPSHPVQVSWAITVPLDLIQQVVLTQGAFNSIPVPANSTLFVIIPPTTNTQTVTLKGITGDTGLILAKTSPQVLALDPSQTTVGLTLGAGSNVTFEFAVL